MSGFAWKVRSPNCLRWKQEIEKIKFTTCQRGLTKGPGGGVNCCDFGCMGEGYMQKKGRIVKTTVTSARSGRRSK